jgi:hypothetical protein
MFAIARIRELGRIIPPASVHIGGPAHLPHRDFGLALARQLIGGQHDGQKSEVRGQKIGARYQVPGVSEKVRSPESEVRSQGPNPRNSLAAIILSPDSCLLSPALQK